MKQPNKEKKAKIKTKSGGTTTVSKKSSDDAKAKRKYFETRPAYKGKEVKDKSGNTYGYKTHDGTYTATTNPRAVKKGREDLARDRKLHKKDSTNHANMTKSFANPIANKNNNK